MTTPVLAANPNWRQAGYILRRALIITRRELRDQFRDWRIIVPIILLTLFFPLLMNFTADQVIQFAARNNAELAGERMVPFLMLVVGFFPISISLVVALESFVGEKERRSIEPLLVSPMGDLELYLGKVIASTLPPLLAAYLGLGVYLGGLLWFVGFTPPLEVTLAVLALTTVQALVMVAGAVVVSTQATSVRSANLLASFIIIPVSLLIQVEAIVMFWGVYQVLWLFVFGLGVLLMLLVRMGVKLFNREELLGREMDVLNLKLMATEFWKRFVGSARNPFEWWTQEVLGVLRVLWLPALFMVGLMLWGVVIGWDLADQYPAPAVFDISQLTAAEFTSRIDQVRLNSAEGIVWITFHNLRALTLATLAGIFSLGVLGAIILMLPFITIGFLLAQVALSGLDPALVFSALFLPHAWVEIPAMFLIGAAVLRLGASLISPPGGQTLTLGWLNALADWFKVALGLVLPLLILAATLEAFLTPQVAIRLLFGG